MTAWVRSVGAMALGALLLLLTSMDDASGQSLTVSLNGREFQPGETVTLAVTASEPLGQPADLFVGVLLPDQHSVVILLPGGFLATNLDGLASWSPTVQGLGAGAGAFVNLAPALTYTFTGVEPPGCYTVFAALTLPAALADSSVEPGQILALITATFSTGTIFVTDPGIPAGTRATIRAAAGAATCFFAQRGLGSAGQVTLTAHSTADLMIDPYALYLQQLGFPAQEARAQSQSFWLGGALGVSGPGHFFLNTGQIRSSHPLATYSPVAHDYFHLLQYALAGGRSINVPDDQTPNLGPRWLIEGSAVLLELLITSDEGLASYANQRADHLNRARSSPAPLISLESWTGMVAAGTDKAYALGFVAAELLANRPGLGAFSVFWAAIGDGASWQAAFVQAFGRSATEFYGEFEALRPAI